MSRKREPKDALGLVDELTAADNHATVCTVLRWAKHTPGVTGDVIGEVCEQLGLNLLDALAYGRKKARQS